MPPFGIVFFPLGQFHACVSWPSFRPLENAAFCGFYECHGIVKGQHRHIENPLKNKQFQRFFPDKRHLAAGLLVI